MQHKELILKTIQGRKEDDFSKDVLMVLLEKLGYRNVEFNGGSYEQGKDIIAILSTGLGKDEIHVFQSKRFKSKRTTASRTQFSEYIYQLTQCIQKSIPLSDGSRRRPNKVFFVTPYQIDTRHLEEQFETLSLPNIEVIDGDALADSIIKNWPSFRADMISDVEIAISPVVEEILNVELNKALHVEKSRRYAEYYSDLNFFVGEVDSSLIIGGRLECQVTKSALYSKDEWEDLKKLHSSLQGQGTRGIVSSPIAEIEYQYMLDWEAYNNVQNLKLIKQSSELRVRITAGGQKINTTLTEALNHYGKIKESGISTQHDQLSEVTAALSLFEKFQDEVNVDNEARRPPRSGIPKEAYTTICYLCDTKNEILSLKKELSHIYEQIVGAPVINAEIDPDGFVGEINSKISYAEECIQKLNNHQLTNGETKAILDDVNSLLRAIDIAVHQSGGIISFSVAKGQRSKNILDISAHSLFDSGCNIAIYGEAGAGKTTTLHMYAEKLYQARQEGQIILFLPLNRITKKIGEIDTQIRGGFINQERPFESLLNAFLIYKGLPASTENRKALILALRDSKKCTVIVDALDEASTHAPWVIHALSELPDHIGHAQVITSSRNCVKYIREIEFLGITLLPFTKSQLKRFIYGWVGDDGQASDLWRKIEDRKLYDVAKNPLLATIICSLHTSNVTIPENEPEIYWRKIELLCGLYDHHKGISRTKNEKSFLEACCIKLGYRFHRNEIRETSIVEMNKFLLADFEGRYPAEKLSNAIEDLIFSCNILIRQPGGDNYGFEHLRYQELLAAKEIEQNRSIDMVELVGKEWWKGSLYLYSFNHDIQFLIDELYGKKGNIFNYKDTLMLMIEARPARLRDNLRSLVNRLAKQDSFDGYGYVSGFEREPYDEY